MHLLKKNKQKKKEGELDQIITAGSVFQFFFISLLGFKK